MFLDLLFIEFQKYTAVYQPYFVEFTFDKSRMEGIVN